jgi:formylglycine-generating enzyme required for sulfatase activity
MAGFTTEIRDLVPVIAAVGQPGKLPILLLAGLAVGCFSTNINEPAADPPFAFQPTFITIPAGIYTIGCTAGQSSCEQREKPAMPVKLTRDFVIMSTEVTQSQYQTVMGTNPSHFSGCGGNCPVEQVSWDEAVDFADALSEKEGLTPCKQGSGWSSGLDCTGYRLPTEAEWEVASRGGQDLLYSGSNEVGDVAWCWENSGAEIHPVATKSPNAWGLYDMSGNVWEWVWDRYAFAAYKKGFRVDPMGPNAGRYRVIRGGSYDYRSSITRVATRLWDFPVRRSPNLGLRLVRTIP